MYVISKVTECCVVEGGKYQVAAGSEYNVGVIYVIDSAGEGYPLYGDEWEGVEDGDLDILRERIEALQEENAELKSRLAGLGK